MNPQKTYSLDEAQKLLENYCAYQERCHKDVTDKLRKTRFATRCSMGAVQAHLVQIKH